MTPRLTLTSACATTSRSSRSPRPTTRWSDPYPVDRTISSRASASPTISAAASVVRAGYGRFYDKTHFELLGGIYTGTPFTNSFLVNFPTSAADPGPRATAPPEPIPYLVNGPVVNRALLDQQFPPGRLLRNTGASWDSADCRTPYTDDITIGYERQLAASLGGERRLRARGQPRPDDPQGHQPRPACHDGGDGSAGPPAHPELTEAYASLRATYPGFANFTTAVTQPLNVADLDYDALLVSVNKRFNSNYEPRVLYTLSSTRRQHDRQRRPAERLPGAGRPAPRAERRAVELRLAAQFRGQRPGDDPEEGRPQRELGGAGAGRHAVHAGQQPGRPGPQREPHRTAARRQLCGQRR